MCLSCNVEDSCHQWSDPAISVGLASQVWHWFLSCNPELYNLKTWKDLRGFILSLSTEWMLDSSLSISSGTRTLITSSLPLTFLPSVPCLSLGENLHPPCLETTATAAANVCLLTTELSLCRYLCTVILPAVLSYHVRFIRGKTEAWKRLSHYPDLYR